MQKENAEEEDNIQIVAVTSDNKTSDSQLYNSETKTKCLEDDKQKKGIIYNTYY